MFELSLCTNMILIISIPSFLYNIIHSLDIEHVNTWCLREIFQALAIVKSAVL